MKIFSAAQVRQWDAYTIAHEPVSSVNLMERAATACTNWLTNKFKNQKEYALFCGTGNNGGDGLAIARMLISKGNMISVYILEGEKRSTDFSVNLDRLELTSTNSQFIRNTDFLKIPRETIVIDALFGSGLNRPLQGLATDLVEHINRAGNTIISIDIPSGLLSDPGAVGKSIIQASHTLSFQSPKLAFFMADNYKFTGSVHLLDIGLHCQFYGDTSTLFNTIDQKEIAGIYKPRKPFTHKYNFGHALLYAGSKNMMGAAVLCAKACLRIGAGLVTLFTQAGTQPVIQSALPEAISSTDNDFESLSKKKSVIGIGPGLVQSEENQELLQKIITSYQGQLVIDAAALQMLSSNTRILLQRNGTPAILTPHTGEFEKLFGTTNSDFERMETALQNSIKLECFIILKGHHTLITCPDGSAFFNTTGNAGMATAGSGDVLTGILTGLLAQGYSQKDACLLGVYLHGMAGDIAAHKMSQEAMIASDIIDCIGEAYKKINLAINS